MMLIDKASGLRRACLSALSCCLFWLAACDSTERDWKGARSTDSAESYERFISLHAEAPQVKEARQRIAEIRYVEVKKSGSPAAIKRFIDAHPDATVVQNAKADLVALLDQKVDESFQLVVRGNVTWPGTFKSSFDPQKYLAAEAVLQEVLDVGASLRREQPLAANNLAVLLASRSEFEKAAALLNQAQASANLRSAEIEPTVLAMTISGKSTAWMAVVQPSGGNKVDFKYVWEGDRSPNMFAPKEWYAKRPSFRDDARLAQVIRENLMALQFVQR